MANCRGWLGCVVLLGCIFAGFTSAAEPTEEALTAVRAALAGRDIPGAKEALAAAAKVSGDAKFDEARATLAELTNYVEQFWGVYDKALVNLAAVEELEVGDTRVAIVEVGPDKLIIRAAGTNRTYNRKTVPPGIALVVAEQVLKPNVPQNKVVIGAFAAMDAKGDLDKARKYWQEAQAAGLNVKHLMAELSAPRALPPVEIPVLTQQQKLMLAPQNWAQRTLGPRGYVRGNLEIAEQNDEGQLVVNVPADLEQVQVVTKRGIPGDFVCRVILQNVAAGQKFGLFAPDTNEDAVLIDLPEGTMLVEFARQGAEYKARIAGKDVEVKLEGKPPARFPGLIGVSGAAGNEFTIAAVDFAGR